MKLRGSLKDPFQLVGLEFDGNRSNTDARGRTIRHPAIVDGERTAVFVTAGQSNISNWSGPLYTPTSAKVENLNIFDGGLYNACPMALGSDGAEGYWPYRLADKIIGAGTFDRVILVPIAVGGSAIAEWSPGGQYHQRIGVAFARCAAAGLPVTAVLFQQGERDNALGTSRVAWRDCFNAMVAGHTSVPWIVAKSTLMSGSTLSANVRSAVSDVIDGVSILAGPDTDTLTGATYRQGATGTHFNGVGADACASLWKTAIEAALT